MTSIPEGQSKSRRRLLEDAGREFPDLPDLGTLRYLADDFDALGRTFGPDGQVMPFAEILAYSEAVSPLDRWEANAIRLMSQAYVTGHREGSDVLSVPPWMR